MSVLDFEKARAARRRRHAEVNQAWQAYDKAHNTIDALRAAGGDAYEDACEASEAAWQKYETLLRALDPVADARCSWYDAKEIALDLDDTDPRGPAAMAAVQAALEKYMAALRALPEVERQWWPENEVRAALRTGPE